MLRGGRDRIWSGYPVRGVALRMHDTSVKFTPPNAHCHVGA